jgi:hypothetical protein
MFLSYLYPTKISVITQLKVIYELCIKLSHYDKHTVFITCFKLIYTITHRYYLLMLFVSIRSHMVLAYTISEQADSHVSPEYPPVSAQPSMGHCNITAAPPGSVSRTGSR